MWSPASAMVWTVRKMAAMPLEVSSPPVPPSRAAIRFSATSEVGFINRV